MVRNCQVTFMLKILTPTIETLNSNILNCSGGIYGCSYPKQHSQEIQSNNNSQREDIFTAEYEAGYKACLDEKTLK
jgi:hypothetical protein